MGASSICAITSARADRPPSGGAPDRTRAACQGVPSEVVDGLTSGPFVDSPQALAVLAAFAALSALLLQRRDVA